MRKCSECGNPGHNLRTCSFHNTKKFRLFGVQLNLTSPYSSSSFLALHDNYSVGSSSSSSCNYSSPMVEESGGKLRNGYASDEPIGRTLNRKKGVAWTKEEHKMFLLGLQKLGKGEWKAISKNFVTTRTPTQVASHAQKYFIRQVSPSETKRRSSLFDMGMTCQPQIQNLSEGNNFCGLKFDTTKASAAAAADFNSSIKLDSFASDNPSF